MNTARIASITAEIFHTPLHNPFVTSQGASTHARAVAVHLTLEDGRVCRGESVPVGFVTGESVDTVVTAVNDIAPELIGLDAARYGTVFAKIAGLAASARCGIEMATLEAWTLAAGGTLHNLWGGALDSMETDITIPIVPNAAELTELAWALGIRTFKIKVGDADTDADFARVMAVQQTAPEARLRIDANQAFTPQSAVAFAERLVVAGIHIELLEQPVPKEDFVGLGEVAKHSPIPVFADETVRTPQDALRLVSTTAVQGINCKINKSGIAGVLEIAAIARAAGRTLMIGCMLETRRSIAVSLAIACGTGAFTHLDLDSHLLLDEPHENGYFQQEGSRLILP